MTQHTSSEPIYTIDQVSAQCRLAPYILRYWEMHFPDLSSPEGRSKSHYSANDIALIMRIKKLLYSDRVTIEEAKKRLEQEKAFPVRDPVLNAVNPVSQGATQQEPVAQPVGQNEQTAHLVADEEPTDKGEAPVVYPTPAAAVSTDEKLLQLNETLQMRLKTLQAELEAERAQKTQLQDQVEQGVQKLAEMKLYCDAIEQRMNDAEQAKEHLQQVVTQVEQAQIQLQDQLSTTEQARAQVQQQLDEERQLHEHMQQHLDELAQGRNDLQQQLQEVSQDREVLQQQLAQMQADAEGLLQTGSALEGERDALVQEISNLRQQNVEKQQDNEHLKGLLSAALEALKAVRSVI